MIIKLAVSLFLLTLSVISTRAQGFVNLNFESANVAGYPSAGSEIPATNAFPGWNAVAVFILYNTISLGGDSISIEDTNGPGSFPTIQGKYFAFFESDNSPNPGGGPISLGQTGLVPSWAKSISFWGTDEGLQVSFAGQPLAFTATGGTANYTIYTADISAYAGQTGELLFTAPPFSGSDQLDNIRFSPVSVPEPGVSGLSAVAGLFLAWRCRKARTN